MSLFDRQLAKKGQKIEITDRTMTVFNGEPSETFSNPVKVKALIITVTGVKIFDSTNTKRIATHKICMYYQSGITSEKWIKLLNNKRLKVLTVENPCEANERLTLMCSERGLSSKVVNDA